MARRTFTPEELRAIEKRAVAKTLAAQRPQPNTWKDNLIGLGALIVAFPLLVLFLVWLDVFMVILQHIWLTVVDWMLEFLSGG